MNNAMHTKSDGSDGKDGQAYREQIADMEPMRNGELSSSQGAGGVGAESQPAPEESGRRWWKRGQRGTYSHTHFKVFKRRWFGLAQLVLLNIVVSWDVSCCYGWLDGNAL